MPTSPAHESTKAPTKLVLTADILSRLDAECARTTLSRSALARLAIMQYLDLSR